MRADIPNVSLCQAAYRYRIGIYASAPASDPESWRDEALAGCGGGPPSMHVCLGYPGAHGVLSIMHPKETEPILNPLELRR